MNSEDIYSSLRGVTEAIQNFSFRSQEDMNEPMKRDSKKDDGDSVSIKVATRLEWKNYVHRQQNKPGTQPKDMAYCSLKKKYRSV